MVDLTRAIGAPIVAAYGLHVVAPKQVYRLDTVNDELIYVGVLGEGPWHRILRVYMSAGAGLPWQVYDIDHPDDPNKTHPDVTIRFMPGERNQPPDALYADRFKLGFSWTAAIVIKVSNRSAQPFIDPATTTGSEPASLDIRVVAECLKLREYNASGQALNGGARVFSTKPAWCTIDFLTSKRYGLNLDIEEIDFAAWADFQSWCDEQIADTYTPKETFSTIPTFNRGWPDPYTPPSPRYTVGFAFSVSHTVWLTKLGRQFAAAHTGTHQVAIWNDASGALLANVSVNPAAPIAAVGNIRLDPGTVYVIGVTEGDAANPERGDSWSNVRNVSSPSGEVNIIGSRWVASFGKPIHSDPGGNCYGDPIMEYDLQQVNRQIPRFSMNVALLQDRDAIAALAQLEQHCFFKVIEANGKYRPIFGRPRAARSGNKWYAVTASGAPDVGRPLFHFHRHNIIAGTFRFDTVPIQDLPKEVIGVYRNRDDDLLRERRVKIKRVDGRGKAVELDLGTMTTSQAVRVTSAYTRWIFDLRKRCVFKATPQSLPVTKFDAVQISHRDPGWEYQLFEVHQLNISSDGSRTFLCKEYNPSLYSDTDISPLDSLLDTTIIDYSQRPPHVPANSIVLQSVTREQPNGSPALYVQGTFLLIYPAVSAEIYLQENTEWKFTGIDASGSFLYGPVTKKKQYVFKFQSKNPIGVKADFDSAPIKSIVADAPPGSLDPTTRIGDLMTLLQLATSVRNFIPRGIFGTLLPVAAHPWFWAMFAVAIIGSIVIKVLNDNIAGVIEGPQNLTDGEILVDIPAQSSFEIGQVIWGTVHYLKKRLTPGLGVRGVEGSVVLQVLCFDIATDGTWKATVRSVADLPTQADQSDLRIVRNTEEIYKYVGGAWVKIGNVLGRVEKETNPRRFLLFLFAQDTPSLAIPANTVEVHIRVEVGQEGLDIDEDMGFALSKLDIRTRGAGSSPTPTTRDYATDFRTPTLDVSRWEEIHLDADGSVTQSDGLVVVSNGGGGQFGGTADTGSGIVYSLPDDEAVDDGSVAYDHDFDIIVRLGSAPTDGTTIVLLRASNAADAACVGVKYSGGKLIIVSRHDTGQQLVADNDGLSVALNDGDYIRATFSGARLLWQHSTDGSNWTEAAGPSNNQIIPFPLAKIWLCAGGVGAVSQAFKHFSISIDEPIDPPIPQPPWSGNDQSTHTPIFGFRHRNLVVNGSGEHGTDGWQFAANSFNPGRYFGRPAFILSGPRTFLADQVVGEQLIEEPIDGGEDYILSSYVSWANASVCNGSLDLAVAFFDANDNELDRLSIALFNRTTTPLRRAHILAAAPADCVRARVRIVAGGSGFVMGGSAILRIWQIQLERKSHPAQTEPSRPNNEYVVEDAGRRARRGLAKDGTSIRIGRFSVAGLVFSDNSPSAGAVSWSEGTIYLNGVAYPIEGGWTSNRFIFWYLGDSTFTTSNSKPAMSKSLYYICLNRSGTAYVQWDRTGVMLEASHGSIGDIDGSLDDIRDGTTYIKPTANQVTGGGRAFVALDSSNRLVTGTPNKTSTEIETGVSRATTAIDQTNVIVAGSIDFSRNYTNKGALATKNNVDLATPDVINKTQWAGAYPLNGDFEFDTGGVPNDWTVSFGVVVDTTESNSGKQSCRIPNGKQIQSTEYLRVSPSRHYLLIVSMKTSDSCAVQVGVECYNNNKSALGTRLFVLDETVNFSTWRQPFMLIQGEGALSDGHVTTFITGTRYIRVLIKNNSTSSVNLYIDNVSFSLAPTPVLEKFGTGEHGVYNSSGNDTLYVKNPQYREFIVNDGHTVKLLPGVTLRVWRLVSVKRVSSAGVLTTT